MESVIDPSVFCMIEKSDVKKQTIVAFDVSVSMKYGPKCLYNCSCKGTDVGVICAVKKLTNVTDQVIIFPFGPNEEEIPLNIETFKKKFSNEDSYISSTNPIGINSALKYSSVQQNSCNFIIVSDGSFDTNKPGDKSTTYKIKLFKEYLEDSNLSKIASITILFINGSSETTMNQVTNDVTLILEKLPNAIPLSSILMENSSMLSEQIDKLSVGNSYIVPTNHFDAFGLFTFDKNMTASALKKHLENYPIMSEQLFNQMIDILQNRPSLAITSRVYVVLHNALGYLFGKDYHDKISQLKPKASKENIPYLDELFKSAKTDIVEFNAVLKTIEDISVGKYVLNLQKVSSDNVIEAIKDGSFYKLKTLIENILQSDHFYTKNTECEGMCVLDETCSAKQHQKALKTMFSQKGPILLVGYPLLFVVATFLTNGMKLEQIVMNMFMSFLQNPKFLINIGFANGKFELPHQILSPPMLNVVTKVINMYSDVIFSNDIITKGIVMKAFESINRVVSYHCAFSKLLYNGCNIDVTLPKQIPRKIGCIALVGPYYTDPQPNLPSIVLTLSKNENGIKCVYLDRSGLANEYGNYDTHCISENNLTFLSESLFSKENITCGSILNNKIVKDIYDVLTKMQSDGTRGLLGHEMKRGALKKDILLNSNIDRIKFLIPENLKYSDNLITVNVPVTIPKDIMALIISRNLGLPNMEQILKEFSVKMGTNFNSALITAAKNDSEIIMQYTYYSESHNIVISPEKICEIMQKFRDLFIQNGIAFPPVIKVTDFVCEICYENCEKNDVHYGCGHYFCGGCHTSYREIPKPGKLFNSNTWNCPLCRFVTVEKHDDKRVVEYFNKYPDGTPPKNGARCCEMCTVIFANQLSCGDNPENIPKLCEVCRPVENITKCPECTFPYERTSGCDHITCPKCDNHFCHICQFSLKNIPGISNRNLFSWLNGKYWACGKSCNVNYVIQEYDGQSNDTDNDSEFESDFSDSDS